MLKNGLEVEGDLVLLVPFNVPVTSELALVNDVLESIVGSMALVNSLPLRTQVEGSLTLTIHIESSGGAVQLDDYYFLRTHGVD